MEEGGPNTFSPYPPHLPPGLASILEFRGQRPNAGQTISPNPRFVMSDRGNLDGSYYYPPVQRMASGIPTPPMAFHFTSNWPMSDFLYLATNFDPDQVNLRSPLTDSEIEQYCVVDKYSAVSAEGARMCSICLEEFSDGVSRGKLGCLHVFHETCLVNWLKVSPTCPQCRFNVRSSADGEGN